MTYRPLFELADVEQLDRAALDRWFGVPMEDLPVDCVAEWYAWRRAARDSSSKTPLG